MAELYTQSIPKSADFQIMLSDKYQTTLTPIDWHHLLTPNNPKILICISKRRIRKLAVMVYVGPVFVTRS